MYLQGVIVMLACKKKKKKKKKKNAASFVLSGAVKALCESGFVLRAL